MAAREHRAPCNQDIGTGGNQPGRAVRRDPAFDLQGDRAPANRGRQCRHGPGRGRPGQQNRVDQIEMRAQIAQIARIDAGRDRHAGRGPGGADRAQKPGRRQPARQPDDQAIGSGAHAGGQKGRVGQARQMQIEPCQNMRAQRPAQRRPQHRAGCRRDA
jgi:hypothetical protein